MKSIWTVFKPWNLPWLIVVIGLAVTSYYYYGEYEAYRNKTPREVVLLDTWSEMRGSKHSVREEFVGYFRDNLTGVGFEYPVSGGLHQSFSKTLKAMPLKFPLAERDLKIGHHKDWMPFVFLIAGMVALVLVVCRIGVWGETISKKSYEKHRKE
jgi:hypothetical protein